MKLSGHEDLRVQKTIQSIQSIRTAFSVMLLKEDYRKITVTALCRQAVINKKTFYRYYDSVDALLEEILSEFSKGYVDILADYRLPEDLDKINAAFFHYAVHQGPLYEKILCSVSYQHLSSHLVEEYIAKSWGTAPAFQQLSPGEQELFTTFIHATGLSMYRQWVEGGKKISLEEVIEITNKLLSQGVSGLLQVPNPDSDQ